MKELRTISKKHHLSGCAMISQVLFEILDDEGVNFSDICRVHLAPDPTVNDRWFFTIIYLYQEYDQEETDRTETLPAECEEAF